MDNQPSPLRWLPERIMDYDLIDDLRDEVPALTQARLLWSNGFPIPADLAVDLMQLGYDVHALEAEYSH